MKIIPLSSLIIPENRQRRDFDEKALFELAVSIQSKGLFHPPVVRIVGDKFELVAGERRTRAIVGLSTQNLNFNCNAELVPPGCIPVTILEDLSPIDLREAELEENTIRKDLTWQEQAEAVAELDALRKEQAALRGETHTTRSTASEILGKLAVGAEVTRVTEAIVVAKHLDDPDVAKAKTAKEALKVIRKKAEAAHREVLAANFNPIASPHSPMLGSCFDLAPHLPENHYDLLLTDPPYGVGADNFGGMAGVAHNYEDSREYALSCYELAAVQGFRVCKEQAHAYVFLDPRMWDEVSLIFLKAGWDVWPTQLIWNKLNGMLPKPDYGPRRTYEMILFASKGGKKVHKVGMDVLTYPMVSDREHGAQKPVLLYADLMSRSTYPGDKVVDFFMGSGTIFPASNKMKLVATGMERVEPNFNLAVSRIEDTEDTLDLLPELP